ncbi:conserved Plasmodium protein, unknown function [Plasmodium relictum]|uniref:Uncharacterized protein n=1 Tax=Plasmodium relictum TaxID=85471 RepID=A0A1J1H3S0_PLARL|nr:conserved Plasmodium protein, unknown function [Plasmodium relictum]CRG99367.1 conserved Plasmodium protein, unknown function [Plasmodium relictum]
MLKITRERRKYRINNPYDESEKIAIKQKKNEELKKKAEHQLESSTKENNAAENFIKIYNKYLEKNDDIEKYKRENKEIEESKKKTVSRKKIKKLNYKLKKNSLIEKLIKKRALIKANEALLNSSNKNNKDFSLNTNDEKYLKLIENKNNVHKGNSKMNTKKNSNFKKKKDDIVNEYDKIINSNNYLQNPLEFAKNIIKKKKKIESIS